MILVYIGLPWFYDASKSRCHICIYLNPIADWGGLKETIPMMYHLFVLKKFAVVWWKVIIVSALSLSLKYKERLGEREIETA